MSPPGMPYYDPTQNQFGAIPQPQPPQYQMPDQTMGYNNYLANNQTILMNQSSQFQQTMQIAQNNFHQHMQTVLQGTMAAGMALYNTGKSAVDKSREHIYQDMLVNQSGNYVLERSFMRDATWGLGIAGSDFGRKWQIGGRKPEYLSKEELEFQMRRSWGHRLNEIGYGLVGGGGAMGADAAAMYLPQKLGLGMFKATGVGLLASTMTSAFVEEYLAPKQNRLEFRKFSEVLDLNQRVGQSRLSDSGSDALADRFFAEERHAGLRMIPFVGDFLAGRAQKNIVGSKVMKQMMASGLFKDTDLNDIDAMEKQVRDTGRFIEKFAGLAHTTHDTILNLKATLNQVGMNNAQQNQAISKMTTTSMATGIDINTLTNQILTPALSMSVNSGYNKSFVTSSALQDVGAIRAMQESGLLDRLYDPATLALQNVNTAIGVSRTGVGTVARYGRGDVNLARMFFAKSGSGSAARGWAMNNVGEYNTVNTDPLDDFRRTVQMIGSKTGQGEAAVAAWAKAQGIDPVQAVNAYWNEDVRGAKTSAALAEQKRALATGDYSRIRSFNPTAISNINEQIFGTPAANSSQLAMLELSTELKQNIDISESEKSNYGYFVSGYKNRLTAISRAIASGDTRKYHELRDELEHDIRENRLAKDPLRAEAFATKAIQESSKDAVDKATRRIGRDSNISKYLSGRPVDGSFKLGAALIGSGGGGGISSLIGGWLMGGASRGLETAGNADIYKLMREKVINTPEALQEAVGTYNRDNIKPLMSRKLWGMYKRGEITKSEYDRLMTNQDVWLDAAAYAPVATSTEDAHNELAIASSFNELRTIDPKKYNDITAYRRQAATFGTSYKNLQNMVKDAASATDPKAKSEKLDAIKKWFTMYGQQMQDASNWLENDPTSKRFLHLKSIVDTGQNPSGIIKALSENLANANINIGSANAPSASDGGVTPNDQMIKDFTTALNKLSSSLT